MTLSPGDDIQTAIDRAQPGDILCLNPGIYAPLRPIDIKKSVNLRGPQAGIDPRPSHGTTRIPGDSSTEAIVDGGPSSLGGIIVIRADTVVLEGLEVRNGRGELIFSESATPTRDTILRHNIIHGSSADEAVRLRNAQDAVIEYNFVYATGGDGISLCCGSSNGTVRFNEVNGIDPPTAGIFANQ
jgi:nitrous oxidase accessory protein